MTIELFGLENIPIVDSSSDISEIIKDAIDKQGCSIEHGDIILIAETLISKSEGTFINVDELVPSEKAIDLAEKSKKDPKLVEELRDYVFNGNIYNCYDSFSKKREFFEVPNDKDFCYDVAILKDLKRKKRTEIVI